MNDLDDPTIPVHTNFGWYIDKKSVSVTDNIYDLLNPWEYLVFFFFFQISLSQTLEFRLQHAQPRSIIAKFGDAKARRFYTTVYTPTN